MADASERAFRMMIEKEGSRLPGCHRPGLSPTTSISAKQVLNRAWARLTINFEDDVLTYTAAFSNDEKPVRLRCKRELLIRNGFVADIRYFPRRAGVFRGGEVDGQKAWAWVRENSGVAVIDHGFRIPPYGQEDDDWLAVDADNAHNSRVWRSSISDALFPIAPVS